MTSRYELEVTIISAKHLKNINWFHGGLKPYAVVWVDPANKVTTRVDEEGDTAPFWDQKLVIPFNSPIEDSTLHIDIVNAKPGEGTKPLIGSAKIPLHDVVNEVGLGNRRDKELDLKRPSGRPHGKLNIGISVRDPRYRSSDSYYAPPPPYGIPQSGTRDWQSDYSRPAYGSPYDAPPQYGAPPPSGYPQAYGAPPPSYGQPGYGYNNYGGQQPVYQEEKKSGFGGMGTGLAIGAVAGVVGGVALAEGFDALEDHVADEAAERVEDGDF